MVSSLSGAYPGGDMGECPPPSEFGRKGEKEKEGRKGGNVPPHLSLEGEIGEGEKGRKKGGEKRGGKGEERRKIINYQFS